MLIIIFGGKLIKISGELFKVGFIVLDFKVLLIDLFLKKLNDFKGRKVIMNIFFSVGIGVCVVFVRKFNEKVSLFENMIVFCIFRDFFFV